MAFDKKRNAKKRNAKTRASASINNYSSQRIDLSTLFTDDEDEEEEGGKKNHHSHRN